MILQINTSPGFFQSVSLYSVMPWIPFANIFNWQ